MQENQRQEAFDSITRALGDGQQLFNIRPLLIAGFVVVLLLIALKLGRQWWVQRQYQRSSPVFENIAAKIGLSGRERSLLRKIASDASLDTPLTLLLSLGSLDRHSGDYLRRMPGWRAKLLRGKVHAMRRRVFGDDATSHALAHRAAPRAT